TKGFRRTRELLGDREVTVAEGLEILGNVLLAEIGGAMGPLYGTFFLEMAAPCRGLDAIDRDVFGKMLAAALATVQNLGGAKPGDKTMIDALVPAVSEYQTVVIGGADFPEALIRMAAAAEKGRDSTRDMIAKLGRASRLGERSRGILDAGAASCALILKSLAHSLNG
ncbi:MAG TPA: dihydroxyacetone kinase subunit L, partial [Terrimicrobiaceae bacterium]